MSDTPEPQDSVSISRAAAEYAAVCMKAEEIRTIQLCRALLDGDIPESLNVRFNSRNEIVKARELCRALLDGDIPESLNVRFNYRNEIVKALQQQEQETAKQASVADGFPIIQAMHNENQIELYQITGSDGHVSIIYPDDTSLFELVRMALTTAPESQDRVSEMQAEIDRLRESVKFLLSFAPDQPPKGLDPTFYHTLSYEGDLDLHNKVLAAKELLQQQEQSE